MKKSFFLSILAVGALVACSKSEVVDTKFDQAISFENYVGRDAMTKATPYGSAALPGDLGLYGYYLGNVTSWADDSKANLWANAELSSPDWAPSTPRSWANATDNYTFLAYAPYTDNSGNVLKVAETKDGDSEGQNPAVTYNVPTTLTDQIDVLYSNNNQLIQQDDATGGTDGKAVTLNFKHALARLTVKASVAANQAFTFHVKEVKISGAFNTTGSFNLYDGEWASATPKEEGETYTFYTNGPDATDDNGLTSVDYSGTTYNEDGSVNAYGNNYLMMIPTTFKAESPAKLYVKYTTFYEGQESTDIEKELEIAQDFAQGKAYAINLEFSKTTQNITFTVTCDDWENETGITGGNPHEGTDWE